MKRSLAAITIGIGGIAGAQTIDLASTMDPSGYFGESTATGSFARIDLGDGSLGSVGANTGDADGLYNFNNRFEPASNVGGTFGTPVDMFPNEENFNVGTISYDDSQVSGIGVETVSITGLDLGALWTADPARTDTANFSAPTVVSDISDYGIGVWFFNGPGGIAFGAFDAADTVTFTNGVLTSIDVSVSATFSADAFGTAVSYTGSLDFSGNSISFEIFDTADLGFFGPSDFELDLGGTVNAVVPAPASALALVGLAAATRRRRI